MAISINWATKVIYIPKSYLTHVSGLLYELDVDQLRLDLKSIEDSEDGVTHPDTHRHNTEASLSGVTYARIVEIINGYTIEFENDTYTVKCVGANHNIGDVKVVNSVSLIIGNSAGMIHTETGVSGLTEEESDQLAVINTVASAVTAVDGKVTTVDTVVDGIASAVTAVDGKVTTVDTVVDGIASAVTAVDGKVTTVDTVVDGISNRVPAALVDGKMDSTLSSAERQAAATALLDLDHGVELNYTLRQALRVFFAVLAGKATVDGDSVTFRDVNDTKDVATATVGADGDRTDVVLNP